MYWAKAVEYKLANKVKTNVIDSLEKRSNFRVGPATQTHQKRYRAVDRTVHTVNEDMAIYERGSYSSDHGWM